MKCKETVQPAPVVMVRQYGMPAAIICAFVVKTDDGYEYESIELPPGEWSYAMIVDRLIRLQYSQSHVESLICNFLAADVTEKHRKEFEDFQAYRTNCKAEARRIYAYGKETLQLVG